MYRGEHEPSSAIADEDLEPTLPSVRFGDDRPLEELPLQPWWRAVFIVLTGA